MLLRSAAVAAQLVATGFVLTTGAASAEQLNAESARRFVVGKLFSFNCFEGTRGAGRVYADGSVYGSIQIRGQGPVKYAALPAGTLQVRGQSVCASLRGLPMQPCFNVDRTAAQSFRGSVIGLNFAYCDFTQNTPRYAFNHPAARKRATPVKPSAPMSIQVTPPSATVTAAAGAE
jgi:hypothetical protein